MNSRLERLVRYRDDLIGKMKDSLPNKHKGHEVTYKQYLNRELESVSKTIESLKLEMPVGGKKWLRLQNT